MLSYYKIVTAKAPVNIAVIKYWGKSNESLKIPINDSLSGTLSIDNMCATTSVAISDTFQYDELWLNGSKQDLSEKSTSGILLNAIKKLSSFDKKILEYKVHIVSYNNFPTAAGLASSAAGYACLAFTLGHAYGITDPTELSKLARLGSGSACRSLFGGFVQWIQGHDHESSRASQVVDDLHWPEMKVVICVVSEKQKDVSSSTGMARSVATSQLIRYRAKTVVPKRIDAIKKAILDKDFETFADVTMQDSNQFHAICLDTYPPLFYLNDTSRNIIKLCTTINSHFGRNKVAYTFDAGPNACIYLLEDFTASFIQVLKSFFPILTETNVIQELPVQGEIYDKCDDLNEIKNICNMVRNSGVECMTNSLSYLINTSIGGGPSLIDDHFEDETLKP